MKRFLLFALLIPGSVLAQLPEAPQPKTTHEFFDRANGWNFAAMGGARAADTAVTCRILSAGGREVWLKTQTCAGVASYNAAFSAAGVLGAYWMHRTNHHKLERLAPFISTAGSAVGLLYCAWHKGRTNDRL